MANFKDITEEQLAAYLDGNINIDDVSMLNMLVNDSELLDTFDTISELDDVISFEDCSDYSEKLI